MRPTGTTESLRMSSAPAGERAHRDGAWKLNSSSVLEDQPEQRVDEQRERADLHAAQRPEDERVAEQRGGEHRDGPRLRRDPARDAGGHEPGHQHDDDAGEHDESEIFDSERSSLCATLIHRTQRRFVKPSMGGSPMFHTNPWPSAR